MKKILIVSDAGQSPATVTAPIVAAGIYDITETSYHKAEQFIKSNNYDVIVIIYAPEYDPCKVALAAAEYTTAGVMIICGNEERETISEKAEKSGVFILAELTNELIFLNTLNILSLTNARMHNVIRKNTRLESQIEEARLINRAKCILIQYLRLTEPQAHRYIEKQAMDKRTSRIDIARNILTTYE